MMVLFDCPSLSCSGRLGFENPSQVERPRASCPDCGGAWNLDRGQIVREGTDEVHGAAA